ncbi:hypothetical protein DFJ63DRAFT_313793 [Scheffersomyces coipomensis]|uniref:uncharacterized protein n=1 Tax=Scheffersomyces coipomensis TaxID=1788519 RepID=UPI00315E0310
MVHIIPSKSFQLELADAVILATRATESSSESNRCKDNNSFECQKPVNDNTVTIIVAVVIPVVVISIILGYFVFRNYRKDKKEAMEHDPDFDENGEATALPDFPSNQNISHQNMYQIEDPFHNRNSIRYPIAQAGKGAFNKSTASLTTSAHGDPYLDNFVLPYHHQTGSKISLDDYARQFGGENPNYFHHTPSASISRTRNSSFSHLPPQPGSQNISPQKSSLRQVVSTSPTKRGLNIQQLQQQREYTNIPNQSSATLYNEKTEYESNSSDSGNHAANEKFAYDDRNNSQSQLKHESYETATSEPTPVEHDGEDELEYDRTQEANSPFEEEHAMTTSNTTAYTVDSKARDHYNNGGSSLAPPAITINGDEDEGDFDFSMSNETSKEDEAGNTSKSELLGDQNKKILSKSPRISAFNLLKNDSDIEDDDEGQDAEQEEEIKRMKSVYKVYFENKDGQRQEYPVDPDQPLPELDQKDIVRINKDLKMDTNYEKRMTATSSLYNETPIFSQNEQDFYYNQQQQQQQNEQYYQAQPYGYPVEGHYYQQGYVPNLQQPAQAYSPQEQHPSEPLPPLQKLRNASDFRKSTLETYTNFEPRLKNTVGPNGSGSPTGSKPFNPIDSDGWTSPVNSPHMQSQASFSNQGNNNTYYSTSPQLGNQSQQQQQQQQTGGSAPSASQLARSSVVMLNPVTEITKQRKFKPAGSLNGNQPGQGQGQYEQDYNGIENDLIPGNRKSDVRRMMNTNF